MPEVKFSLLEVDLTRNTNRVIDVTEDVRRYLGARGLANKLIWDLVPAGADPLGPENILHIGVGPLTGLVGSKTVLSFISPLTGWAGRSTVSGSSTWSRSTRKGTTTRSSGPSTSGRRSPPSSGSSTSTCPSGIVRSASGCSRGTGTGSFPKKATSSPFPRTGEGSSAIPHARKR